MDDNIHLPSRKEFDKIYDEFILNSGFFEEGKYYDISRERYWKTLKLAVDYGINKKSRIIEFGGGQIAVLLRKLYSIEAVVADISSNFRSSIDEAGVSFCIGNIMNDPPIEHETAKFDVVFLLEVIEHIPVPPYMAFRNIKKILTKNGAVFLTTPNLFRLRNIIRMALGKDIFDRFRMPEPGFGLGHQMEYSGAHMKWQLEEAGYSVSLLKHDQLGQVGHSFRARLARRALAPLLMNAKWREELVIAAVVNETAASKPCRTS